MALNARTKGQNGEREAGEYLASIIGTERLQRNLAQTREGGADHLGIPGLCIEVKRQETLGIQRWWEQVCRAADARHEIPVLMYRQNRKPWQFVLPASLMLVGMPGYVTLGEREFRFWLHHYYSTL
jgi:hypothetical protein